MTLWTVARLAPLSMGLSRQEYWSGWSCPPPGELPYSRIKPVSLISPALADGFFTTNTTREAPLKLRWLRNGKIRFCGGIKWPPIGQSHSDGGERLSFGGQSDLLRKLKLFFVFSPQKSYLTLAQPRKPFPTCCIVQRVSRGGHRKFKDSRCD